MIHRLISIIFCLSLLFVGVVGSTSVWYSRVATQRYQSVLAQTAALQKRIEKTKASRSELEEKIREATDLEDWVLAAMPLQPLLVKIVRGVAAEENATIVELGLERDPVTPSQLRITLILNADSDKAIKSVLRAIREDLNYHERSPTQSMVQGNIEYRASLLWRKPEGTTPSPQERAEESVKP